MNVAHERALAGAAILDDSIARLLLAELAGGGTRITPSQGNGRHW